MPNIVLPLTSIGQSVTRPAIIDIIGQVQDLTKINKDTRIFYPGDVQRMKSAGTGLDSKDRGANFATDRYTFIEVEEDYDPEALGTTAVTRPEHIPVFEDEPLRLRVAPVYATSNVTINFTIRCPSKGEALRWRDEARVRISQMHDVNLHSITYHYLLPASVLTVLKQIYDKREAKFGYGQTFEEWVTSQSTDRLTLVGDESGKNVNLAISETQTRIQGMFTFDGMPEKAERDDDTGTWQISFSYKFTYEKPLEIHLQYPLMVHNQLLDDEFISFVNTDYDLNKVNKSFSLSLHAMNSFEMHTLMNARHKSEPYIRIPDYDDFILRQTANGSGTILTALAEVDETDKRTLFNLRELGDICLDEDILQFIAESEYQYIGKQYASILNLSLYRNEFLTATRSLECDSQLNVRSVAPLDLRNQHRVRLSIITDLTLLSPEILRRIRNYPKALVKIIGSINDLLRHHPNFMELGDRKVVSAIDFSSIYSFLTGYRIEEPGAKYYGPGVNSNGLFDGIDPRLVANYRQNNIGANRVMISNIVAMRRDDLQETT